MNPIGTAERLESLAIDVRENGESGRGRPSFNVRRDVHSRRHGRDRLRRVARVLVLAVGDFLALVAALDLSAGLAGGSLVGRWPHFLPLMSLITLGTHALFRTYMANTGRRNFLRAFAAGMVGALVLALMALEYDVFRISIGDYVLVGILAGTGFVASRVLIDLVVQAVYRRGMGRKSILFVGAGEDAGDLLEQFERSRERRVELVGHLAPNGHEDPTALGSLTDLPSVLEAWDVQSVIISANLDPASLERVIHECFTRGVAVSVVPRTLADIPCRMSGQDVLGWPLVELRVPRLHLVQVLMKRTVDVLLSTAGLILTLPVVAVVAAAIRLESRGPVLFRQERLGVEGRIFTILKFRTMRQDAEDLLRSDDELWDEYVGNDFKLPPDRDPRVTRVGAFLRRSSLDEIPQLINVLRGDMSLVGPRPVVAGEIDHYGDAAPTFLGVKPGITGHWQVNGRSAVAYPERAELDLEYIRNWSLGRDLTILFKTIPQVLMGRGAH